jgi:hypothetical protein
VSGAALNTRELHHSHPPLDAISTLQRNFRTEEKRAKHRCDGVSFKRCSVSALIYFIYECLHRTIHWLNDIKSSISIVSDVFLDISNIGFLRHITDLRYKIVCRCSWYFFLKFKRLRGHALGFQLQDETNGMYEIYRSLKVQLYSEGERNLNRRVGKIWQLTEANFERLMSEVCEFESNDQIQSIYSIHLYSMLNWTVHRLFQSVRETAGTYF